MPMPLPCCSCPGLVVAAAVVALILMPGQDYILLKSQQLNPLPPDPVVPELPSGIPEITLDLIFTGLLIILVLMTHLGAWIQRKLMERRITKLKSHLGVQMERLRALDAQHEQLTTTLKIVHNATCEYNLLLWLLLRRRRLVTAKGPNSDCFFGKQLDGDYGDLGDLGFLPPTHDCNQLEL